MNLIEALNWRYAAKRMNGEKVPAEKVENILEAIRLAPTSLGMQPFSVILIENEELRKKIQPAAYNQPQIAECSHLIVFAAWNDVTVEHVNTYLQNIVATRNVPLESLDGFKGNLMNVVNHRTQEQKREWAAKQVYIALGIALTAAALEQVDATPMEGFKPAEVDQLLGLEAKGLHSVCLMTLGYRDTNTDYLVNQKKVRRGKDQFVEVIEG
jgi:nitroreductase